MQSYMVVRKLFIVATEVFLFVVNAILCHDLIVLLN
jgi:hypothetical protein